MRINHAHNIVALNLGPQFLLQTVLTFCVPYMVFTYSTAMTELANARAAAGSASAAPGATPGEDDR